MHKRAFVVIALALLPSSALHAQKSGITPAQVARISWVNGMHLSPDGTQLAFTRIVQRPIADGPGSAFIHLYAVDLEGGTPRLLLGGEQRVGGVSWSPDGKEIQFLRRGGDHSHAEIYALPMSGGEPRRVTKTARGVGSYDWSPDGRYLAYTMIDERPELRAAARKMGFKQKIVDEDYVHVSMHLWDSKTDQHRRMTSRVTVNSLEWSPTGRRIACGIAPRNLVDDRYMFTRLHIVDPRTAMTQQLVDNPGKLGDYEWSPDGKHLAYVSAVDRNDPHAGMLYIVDCENRNTRAIWPGFEGMVHSLNWKHGQRKLLASVSMGVKSGIRAFDPFSGDVSTLSLFKGFAVTAFEPVGPPDEFLVVASSSRRPAEIYRAHGMRRVSSGNEWMKEVALGKQEIVRFKTRGLEIEGLLMYPVGYEEGKRYPLIIVAHGGPESHFSEGWNTDYGRWGQMLCARGYFAWYPNYRASTGYGVAFAKADHGDPMGGEFQDHLDAIELFDRQGLVDPARVGLGGGSYGGYTAAWAATKHSKHFAAAVSFVPFVDIRTKWYTSDIPHEFHRVHYQDKWPHEQREFLASRSPLTFAQDCRTPLLLAGGTSDPRVHPSQPFMLHRAVKFATRTPTRYVQYPGEGHGNRQNVYRFDYCVRSLRWFDHYLKPGNHRSDSPPAMDIDYEVWMN